MERATWMDYWLSCFAGEMPIKLDSYIKDGLSIPYHWLFAVSGGLILNLDYMISDLETEGIQFILQTRKRTSWYFSKMIWNLISSALYFLGAGMTALLFAVLFKGVIRLDQISKTSELLFQGTITNIGRRMLWKLWLCGISMPFFGFCTFNLLQMTLCLFIKPAISLIICLGMLVFSVYIPSPWMPGNAMMGIRNSIALETAELWILIVCLVVLFIGTLMTGRKRIGKMDLLGQEVL